MFLLRFLWSPSRLLAKSLRDKKAIHTFCDVMRWNAIYYLTESFEIIALFFFVSFLSPVLLIVFVIQITWRINELFTAFGTEAFSKKRDMEIVASERLILLGLAYFEVIICFGLIYKSIYAIDCGSLLHVGGWFDFFFFSGATLTTTGSGEIAPVSAWTKFFSVYEAMNGVAYIAIALSTYIGDDEAPTKRTISCFDWSEMEKWTNKVKLALRP